MDSRVSRRTTAEKEVRALIGHQEAWVVIYDLCASGAMIEVGHLDVGVGDDMQLNLHDIISASGEVIWKVGQNAGVRFYGILPSSIVDHLGYSPTNLIFDELTPRDRFGQAISLQNEIAAASNGPGDQEIEVSTTEWLNTAVVREDRRRYDRSDENRRREERLEVAASARLLRTVREGVDGQLIDLSPSGCSFIDPTNSFQQGDQVWLKMEGMELWRGTVRWLNSDNVGVEFDRPFYPAVLNHLVERHRNVVVSRAA